MTDQVRQPKRQVPTVRAATESSEDQSRRDYERKRAVLRNLR